MKKQFTLEQMLENTVKTSAGCLEWQSARTAAGYGQKWDGEKVAYTHRIVCEIINGSVDGLEVLHSCDNPPCINPDHLRWGTRQENVNDMLKRGRAKWNPPKGEASPKAKLTAREIVEIRALRQQGYLLRELAERYNVTVSNIHLITSRKKWKDLQDA